MPEVAGAAPGATAVGGTARPVDGEGKMSLTLRVNGHEHVVRARAHHTLLDVLRGEVGLTGPREGCGVGMCGACTVLLDGRPISSCLLLAPMAEDHDIGTIEGLQGPAGELHPIQQAFVDHTAFQCSYCTPGFIMATKALLAENADPTPEDVRHDLAGNLCRCGSYSRIMASVLDTAERLRAGPSGEGDAAEPVRAAGDGGTAGATGVAAK